ncbi:MAG TPA: vWA domain-containing protein [Novosphingobium sp.]|nr:vWA domain-containing protein [Novosphingobium sp.]
MRQAISLLAVAAMLVQGPAVATSSQDPAGSPSAQNSRGMCAPLAPLPRLAAEAGQQGQNYRPRSAPTGGKLRTAREEAPMVDAVPPPPPPPMAPPPPPPPPAPPPPPGSVADASTGEMVVTGSAAPAPVAAKADMGRVEAGTSMPYPGPPPRRPPRPQSGLLTAGEHDDLLNPELYGHYVRTSNLGQEVRGLPYLDTGRVLTVSVKDGAGRPVPFARVEVACADGNRMLLSTLADGTAAFFPDLDRLGSRVKVRAGGQDWREVAIAPGLGGQRVDFTVGRAAQSVRKLDLMLVIDTTGSMGDEIRYLQSELAAILTSLRQRHPGLDLRVGFVFYRDIGDDYVTATFPLTNDLASAQAELRQRFAGGGGDYPEAMDQALVRAAGQPWRPDAVKTMLLVADAPPHDDKFGTTWLAARHLRANRVQIVPVAASGVADKAEYAMRAMAALTQSRYTFLTDDSGIGNPHAPPAIDCYLVTRLDALLRRVIDSQLSGRRIEPEEQEIIREVGQYDNGRCIIPPGALQQR